MPAAAISVEGLGKRYVLGRRLVDADTLRDQLATLRTRVREGRPAREELWALRDISFEVAPGEVVAVVGRNGAGKSTLLKILARITEPSEGRAVFRGRLASLLEVGTGFHTELTGRENIYLSGATLGMRRAEVDRRFAEIVEFADVAPFLDTPVKRYSSGMFVRLAFAVAAHLETDILLVDEVLAVGDFEFQRKCLGRMRDAAAHGRTVVFVSHNMQAVRSLCTRGLHLSAGRLVNDGPVDAVVRGYLATGRKSGAVIPEDEVRMTGTREALVRQVELVDAAGDAIDQVFFGQPFRVRLLCRGDVAIADLAVELGISTPDGLRVATMTSLDGGRPPLAVGDGWWQVDADVRLTLQPGEYALDVALHHWVESKLTIDWLEQALTFRALDVPIEGADQYVHFATNYNLGAVRGYVRAEAAFAAPRPAEPLAAPWPAEPLA